MSKQFIFEENDFLLLINLTIGFAYCIIIHVHAYDFVLNWFILSQLNLLVFSHNLYQF